MKGSDPEGYRWHRLHTELFRPPPGEVEHIDTTDVGPMENAKMIYEMLLGRGLKSPSKRTDDRQR